MFVFFFLYFFAILSLIFVRTHFLLSLLSLEFIFIYLYYFIYNYFLFFYYDFFFLIVFLVLGVCDGVLGLSLIVYLVRKVNNDYVDSLVLF
nr:NADH dehydrogenase subunit 4L [Tropiduchidae sp. 2 WQW-2023a]